MRLIDADAYIEENECCGYLDEISVRMFDDITPTVDAIEVEKIISVIARLRSNREANLIRYTSNEGKESYVIRSQKDRGYFQALDDVEKSLLRLKEKRK